MPGLARGDRRRAPAAARLHLSPRVPPALDREVVLDADRAATARARGQRADHPRCARRRAGARDARGRHRGQGGGQPVLSGGAGPAVPGGAWALGPHRVPGPIQEVLLARIGRLPHEDRELLQTGAVVGKDVSVAVLRALGGLRDDVLQGALARLTRSEFLYETGAGPDAEYSFKHTLTHEVSYESLAPERRRELHAGITAAIERLHPDRLAEHAERLAHHASRGEVWDKTVAYMRQAGAKALAASAYREAVT